MIYTHHTQTPHTTKHHTRATHTKQKERGSSAAPQAVGVCVCM